MYLRLFNKKAQQQLDLKSILKGPIFVFIFMISVMIYLSSIGQKSLAVYVGISAFVYLVTSFIFKEPRKLLIILVWPLSIGILKYMKMDTSSNITFATLSSLALILATFKETREWSEKILKVIVTLLGGVILFWSSAWGQSQLGMSYPHIITFVLMICYMIWLFFSQKGSLKWIAIVLNLFFLFSLWVMPSLYGQPGSSFYEAAYGQQEAWRTMFKGVQTATEVVAKEFQVSYLIGIGDYEQGVEAQSEKPLGIFLENVAPTSRYITLTSGDEKVDVFGRLRAELFGVDKPLKVNLSCRVEGTDKKGKIVPEKDIEIFQFEARDFDCIFDASAIGVSTANIIVESSFDFETSGFLKSYFIEMNRSRALDREMIPQGKTALDAFGISDKNPVAVFTGGPVKIGMGIGKQPFSVSETTGVGPTLTLTIDNNWIDGKLTNITHLEITAPKGVILTDVDGRVFNDCKLVKTEHVCLITGNELIKIFGKKVSTPKTVRIHSKVRDFNALFEGAPLAIRSFKVNIKYVYTNSKTVQVGIRKEVKV